MQETVSFSPCFGENLRSLAESRGTLAAASRDLGFTKTQFQRYLNGRSHPKPHHLQRICSYFKVDARILIEPLDASLSARMRRHCDPRRGAPMQSALVEAFEYAYPQKHNSFLHNRLEDGFYVQYRKSLSSPGNFAQLLFFIKSIGQSQVGRGYEPHSLHPDGAPRDRMEYRGLVHPVEEGYVIVYHHKIASVRMSFDFFSKVETKQSNHGYVGYTCMARRDAPGQERFSPIYLQRLHGGVPEALAFQRQEPLLGGEDELPPEALEMFQSETAGYDLKY